MKKVFIIIMLSLILCGCNNTENVKKDSFNNTEIKEIMANNQYVIIDVRTKEEYESKHLVDSINIPVDLLNNIEIEKDKILFVYCKSGTRSNIAYETLNGLGYTVYDLGAFDNIDLPKE